MKNRPLTPFAKVLLVASVLAVIYFGLGFLQTRGIIKAPGMIAALLPEKAVLPELREAASSGVTVAEAPAPSSTPAEISTPLIRGEIWEWNAQMGLILANGGPLTTKGSLMAKRNVNLSLVRQDDTLKMQENLIACAKEIHDGATQCSVGANFVGLMGDGVGQFAAAVNPQLKKLGNEYRLVVIGSAGYSRGEDAFMAPPEVKANAQSFREIRNAESTGLLISAVLRDGDWNIVMKWAADNGIKNNPDERTYDPNALNWINATDYNVAAQDYVSGKCENRKIVNDGVPTGETKRVCVNAVATWTPGDVTVVQQKGGLVKVASSKEYRTQMPNAIVGPKAFFDKNREHVVNMLAAMFEAGDQIKTYDSALRNAAEISARVYNDQDGAYWYKYYKGVVETDSQGNRVPLGGSSVNNLADNLLLFGLVPGANDNFRSTYTTFARIAVQQYPAIFQDTPIPPVNEVVDKSFITAAQAAMSGDSVGEAETVDYSANRSGPVVSKRDYNITFDVGQATLTPAGIAQLNQLKDSIAITSLFIRIDGYTDNTGNEEKTNMPLSQARANAVKTFLQKAAPRDFPNNRFAVQGHGSQDPVASNSTNAGRAANRRVKITLSGQ